LVTWLEDAPMKQLLSSCVNDKKSFQFFGFFTFDDGDDGDEGDDDIFGVVEQKESFVWFCRISFLILVLHDFMRFVPHIL
jgi:hypothetical protein